MTEAHAAITLQKVLRGSRARLEHRQRTTYVSRKERRRRGARPDSPAQATPPPQGEAEAAAPEAAGSGGDSQPTERTARGGFKRPNPVLKAGRRQEVQHGEDMRRVFDWFDRDRDGGTPALYLPHVSRTSPAHLPHISRVSPVYLPRISVSGVSAAELHAAIRSLGGASTLSLQEAKDIVWEHDDDSDGKLDWDEFRHAYERSARDTSGFVPRRFFVIVEFLLMDKDFSGSISRDEALYLPISPMYLPYISPISRCRSSRRCHHPR